MLNVSDAYRAAMALTVRPRAYHKVKLRVFNVNAENDNTITSSAQCAYSKTKDICKETGTPSNTYATLERGRFILDGTQIPVPDIETARDNYGWVSATISGEDSKFATNPYITISFGREYDLTGLSLEFDTITGDYVSRFTIAAYHSDGTRFLVVSAGIIRTSFTYKDKIIGAASITITCTKTSVPYRRARIRQILLGIFQSYDNTSLRSSEIVHDVDPIARRLPTETFNFSVIDSNGVYDPDNPDSMWDYVDANALVGVSYGRALLDHSIEWLPEIVSLLNGKPKKNGSEMTFSANRKLCTLNNSYYKGVLNPSGVSLKALAIDVLTDALGDNERLWNLDDSLNNIITCAPMPVLPHRECLQLIANAGMCALYTDNSGVITLRAGYMPNDTSNIEYNGINAPLETPKLEKSSPLRAVSVQQNRYTVDATESELFSEVFTVNEHASIHVEYQTAYDITSSVSGGVLDSASLYASAADFNVSATGNVTITIVGKLVSTLTTKVEYPVTDVGEGEVELVENPLITEALHCQRLSAYHIDYLQLRSTYEFPTRGNPELEAGDAIIFAAPHENNAQGVILKQTVSLNNGTSGNVIVKRITNQRGAYSYTGEIYCGERSLI